MTADLSRRQLLGLAATTAAGTCLLAACVEVRATPQAQASAVAALAPGTRVAALADVTVGGAVPAQVERVAPAHRPRPAPVGGRP